MNKVSMKPCPICKVMGMVIGKTNKGKKLLSCGHSPSFKKTRSKKEMDRKYIKTQWGLEKIE